MSLEDLTQYADAQEDRINHCKSDIAPGPDSLLWTGLWKSVWGKGLRSLEKEELVERDEPSHRIEDPCTNPDAIPPSTSVIEIPSTLPDLWARSSKRILARSEYYEAEQTALSASEIYRDALVIAGHPGIGKSFFLLWLLIRRLALELPTAFQIRPDYALLFHKDGVCQFTHQELCEIYCPLSPDYASPHSIFTSPSSRIWALVNSNQDFTKPAGLFTGGSLFFIVEASFPLSPRPHWVGKANSEHFYMKRWSFSEVLQARSFLGCSTSHPYTERQLWHLHDEYGASPRVLADHAGDPTTYEREVAKHIRSMDPDTLLRTLNSPGSGKISHLIIVTEPSTTSRSGSTKTIASRRIHKMLWDQHIRIVNQATGVKDYSKPMAQLRYGVSRDCDYFSPSSIATPPWNLDFPAAGRR